MVTRDIDAIAVGAFVGLVTVALLIALPLLLRSCSPPDPVPAVFSAETVLQPPGGASAPPYPPKEGRYEH